MLCGLQKVSSIIFALGWCHSRNKKNPRPLIASFVSMRWISVVLPGRRQCSRRGNIHAAALAKVRTCHAKHGRGKTLRQPRQLETLWWQARFLLFWLSQPRAIGQQRTCGCFSATVFQFKLFSVQFEFDATSWEVPSLHPKNHQKPMIWAVPPRCHQAQLRRLTLLEPSCALLCMS